MSHTAASESEREPRFSVRFSARDLVNVAIFAVIYIVITFVIGMVGTISPLVWFFAVPVAIIANGIPFMLFLTRVTHAGMVTLFGAVIALFYLLSGNSVPSTIAIVLVAIAAELVLLAGRYRSRRAAIGCYSVFALVAFTPLVPVIIAREAYFDSANWETFGEEYRLATEQLLSAPVLVSAAIAFIIAGLIGALLGASILRKHFRKAGLA